MAYRDYYLGGDRTSRMVSGHDAGSTSQAQQSEVNMYDPYARQDVGGLEEHTYRAEPVMYGRRDAYEDRVLDSYGGGQSGYADRYSSFPMSVGYGREENVPVRPVYPKEPAPYDYRPPPPAFPDPYPYSQPTRSKGFFFTPEAQTFTHNLQRPFQPQPPRKHKVDGSFHLAQTKKAKPLFSAKPLMKAQGNAKPRPEATKTDANLVCEGPMTEFLPKTASIGDGRKRKVRFRVHLWFRITKIKMVTIIEVPGLVGKNVEYSMRVFLADFFPDFFHVEAKGTDLEEVTNDCTRQFLLKMNQLGVFTDDMVFNLFEKDNRYSKEKYLDGKLALLTLCEEVEKETFNQGLKDGSVKATSDEDWNPLNEALKRAAQRIAKRDFAPNTDCELEGSDIKADATT